MSGPGLKLPPGDPRSPALRQLRPPAFLTMCVGLLNILLCLAALGALALGYRLPSGADPSQAPALLWQVVTVLGGLISGVLSIWGAVSAVSLRNWGLVVVGAVATLLPLSPTCCLGVLTCPWMLWVLNIPEVKQHFTAA